MIDSSVLMNNTLYNKCVHLSFQASRILREKKENRICTVVVLNGKLFEEFTSMENVGNRCHGNINSDSGENWSGGTLLDPYHLNGNL